MQNAWMSRRRRWLTGSGALVLSLALAGCNPITPGEWQASGSDAEVGGYTGQLEIRDLGGGNLQVIRLATLADVTHPDGRAVDTAWTGGAAASSTGQPLLQFKLTRADFVTQVGSLTRGEADKNPLAVTGAVTLGADNALTIHYSADDDPSFSIDESATYLGPTAADPIFTDDDVVAESHPEPPQFIHDFLFQLFATYYVLPDVAPWVPNPEFQRAVHYVEREHTDFQYYRDNPDRLRVVNKVVDAISQAETEIRANAFRATFHDKADYYQDQLSTRFLPSFGMVENRTPSGDPQPDGDSGLWTGEYGWTQAQRYRATGDPQALTDLRKVVRAMMTLMDITGDPQNFARTLRAAGPPLDNWVRGTGDFSDLDWLPGGNNDMGHGLILGLIAGWDALPADDPLRPEIAAHAQGLLSLCEFANPRPSTGCGDPDNPTIFPDGDPGEALIFAGITANDPSQIDAGLAILNNPLLILYADTGGGPIYIYGISDWSGNNLTLVGHITQQWLLARTSDANLNQVWRYASGVAWKTLSTLEMPVHAALAAGLGVLTDPNDQAAATDQAIWGLRSFPFPKHPYPVDHRIRGDWVLSPFPALPWKLDWTTDPGREQGLFGHGVLETSIDNYRWNAGPFDIAAGPVAPDQYPGVDYLFLYWMARSGGLIGASD